MTPSKKNIILVTNYSLHEKRGAAYSRICCYKDALGSEYRFFCFSLAQFVNRPESLNLQEKQNKGMAFHFFKGKVSGYFYRNILIHFDFIKPIKIIRYIVKNYSRKNTTLLVYSSHFMLFFFSILILKLFLRYTIIIEKNELELGIILNTNFPKKIFIIPFILLYPIKLLFAFLIDLLTFFGNRIIVISKPLEKLYRFHPKLYRIPVLVDIKRFEKQNKHNISYPIKTIFLGTLTKKKDAVFELIHAIIENKSTFENKIELTLIGDGNKHILNNLEQKIEMYKLQKIVTINSPIQSEKVPNELIKYDVAILIRKKNIQTSFGFSTKLGEYLAAGLPVLTNDISDNKQYLKDGNDSFFINQVSINEISSKIKEIIESRDNLKLMRESARNTAKKYFSNLTYKEQLINIFS